MIVPTITCIKSETLISMLIRNVWYNKDKAQLILMDLREEKMCIYKRIFTLSQRISRVQTKHSAVL